MSEEKNTQWHSGFYPAVMLELQEDRDILEFEKEYPLNTKPIVVDLLVIKKLKDVTLKNEIGRIFHGHNLIEYKSPHDEMGIDQYFKTYAYASLYKTMSDMSNGIKAEDISLTMLRDSYPRELMKWFAAQQCTITKPYAGIYYVANAGFFDTQIIVSRELTAENHIWLKALTDRLKQQEAMVLLEHAERLRSYKETWEWADSVLQVAIKENRKTFDSLKEGEQMACEALMELMKPEVDKRIEETASITSNRINMLHLRLLDDNRMDDLRRSLKDSNYQKQLFEEYGI